ncbi:MAG TPA: ABC transporter permease [Bryobacteraceae bacterium]|nr:ABC transporter permease [Bryobacteraceae bacterium]
MNLPEAIRFSLHALRANRLRTFLTALGLIIGNASVILVVTISLASKDLILDQIRGIGSNLIYATYDSGGQNSARVQADVITLADLNALREDLGARIVAATGVMQGSSEIVINGNVRGVTLDGVDSDYARVRNIVRLAGRLLDQSDISLRERVALLTDKLAVRIFGSQDAAIGQTVKVKQLEFTVIGTFREKTSTFGINEINDDTILIPLSVMRTFLPYDRVDPVYLQARYAVDVPAVTEEVRRVLQSRHRPGAKYDVNNLSAILETADRIATVLTIVLIVVSTLALLISGIGIMNIMLVTVTERTREIGLRMAVGASRREILLQFLVESVLISLVGGAIGIVIGLMIPISVQFITDRVQITISPWSVIVAFGVSFAVGVGFGLLPAQRAAKLNPTEALRYE